MSVIAAACPNAPVDAALAAYGESNPGVSLAVVKDGSIVFERTYGLANVETGERTTSHTNFRLASVTKQFTAMSILILAERGDLKVDDPVARFLPELKDAAPNITLRHLLTHTSGLPEYEALLAKDDTTQIVDRDVLTLLTKKPLALKPNAKYRYNNTGYALLALVVERASKLPYSEFLARNIFRPLGMTTSSAYDAKTTIPHRAYGYSIHADQCAPADQSRTTAVVGDGGIYSSTADLARWIDGLDRNTLLSPQRLSEATSALVTTNDPNIGYGFGWKIGEQRGEKLVYHTGTTSGFKNVLLWVPARKLGVIVLTNRRQGDTLGLAKFVAGHFWDK